jgi:hypothetical protein
MSAQITTLDTDKFRIAVVAAKERFDLIRKKYPQLKCYLVLCIPGKQTGIGGSVLEILKELPALIVNDAAKSNLQNYIQNPPAKDASEKEKQKWQEEFDRLARGVSYDSGVRVEIRFDDLNYELIFQLQSDELVDRELTPQTRASIRIVLGTLSSFLPT